MARDETKRPEHVHDLRCRRDSEGPTVWYLCGYEPHSVPAVGYARTDAASSATPKEA